MIWDILNSLFRIGLTLIAIYKLSQFREFMIPLERFGLGLMGAGSFLTVSVIWEHTRSPFDGWSVSVMTAGAVIFVAGRAWRDRRHQRANDAHVEMLGRRK